MRIPVFFAVFGLAAALKTRRNARKERLLKGLFSTEADMGTAQLDYGGNHPFERRQRKLDEMAPPVSQETLSYPDRENYEPLRIKFVTDPLESRSSTYGPPKIDLVKNYVLPAVAGVWAQHLNVYPVSGTIPLHREDCFGLYWGKVDDNVLANGMSDADMAIYVGAEERIEGIELCSPGTLAIALTCSIDQFDRPVVGAMNFCLGNVARNLAAEVMGEDESDLDEVIAKLSPSALREILTGNDATADTTLVAIHESGHALGFNLNMFKYFRDPTTGEPLTPRPFQRSNVQCVDGSIQNMEFPAENTIQVFQTFDGRYYHEVVTPYVTQVARNNFDCQTMTGARLENTPTNLAFNCTGQHWDERLFLSELMGPVFSGFTDTLSPLTLALFEDSGWYKVSYETAELSPFGKGSGCDFVDQPCIVNDQVPDYGRDAFCNVPTTFSSTGEIERTDIFCEPTHKSFAICSLFDMSTIPSDLDDGGLTNAAIPYFNDPSLLSLTPQTDWCPMPTIDILLDCTNTEDNALVQTYKGESRGLNSRCINGQVANQVQPGCFDIVCDAQQHKVIIAGQTCEFDFQQLTVWTSDGRRTATLECPRLANICPDLFCPGECAGRGVCDYASTPPRCNCFDETDTSESCSKGLPKPGTFPPSPQPPDGGWNWDEPWSDSGARGTHKKTAIFSTIAVAAVFLILG